jgi:hypothetical protein
MLEEFYEEKKPIGQRLRHKPKALEYSMLHRWFIFVKRNITDVSEASDDENEDTQDEEEEAPQKQEQPQPQQIKKQKGGDDESSVNNIKIEELDLDKIII